MCLPPGWIQFGTENAISNTSISDDSSVSTSEESTNSVFSTASISTATHSNLETASFTDLDAITRELYHSRISNRLQQRDIRDFLISRRSSNQ